MYYAVILFERQISIEIIREIDKWMLEKGVPEYSSFDEFDCGWCNWIRRYGEYREEFYKFLSHLKNKHHIFDLQILERYEDCETWEIGKIE